MKKGDIGNLNCFELLYKFILITQSSYQLYVTLWINGLLRIFVSTDLVGCIIYPTQPYLTINMQLTMFLFIQRKKMEPLFFFYFQSF